MIAKSRGQVVKFAMRRSGVRIIASKPVRTGKALHPTMIEVEPEIAIKIQARARERGVSVAVYWRELIDHKGTESESSFRQIVERVADRKLPGPPQNALVRSKCVYLIGARLSG